MGRCHHPTGARVGRLVCLHQFGGLKQDLERLLATVYQKLFHAIQIDFIMHIED